MKTLIAANDNKKLGTIRQLDPSDPRNIDHPSHKERWLEFARALGRLEAREEYALQHDNDERKHHGQNRNTA
jgi:hypothetical protein